jgi:ethanolamine phosphate phosphodiesterase
VHAETRGSVREITVKSNSMAMGVPTPGFVMASLWNPVDDKGRPLPGNPEKTLQTHLCLLPNQIHTYMKYVAFIVLTLVLLAVRALLVPVLNLTPFAIDAAELSAYSQLLPMHVHAKRKVEPPVHRPGGVPQPPLTSTSTSAWPRARSSSLVPDGRWQASKSRTAGKAHHHHHQGWSRGPRINLDEQFYDPRDARVGGTKALGVVGREMWTSTWRVAWVAVLFWVYLSREK